MLSKRLDGVWTDRLGFIAAVMLKWNQTDAAGKDHYVFLSSPFNAIPHDIVSNGEDDSVLLSQDMYNTLLLRKAVRPFTDEEAAEANKNLAIIRTNEENANDLAQQDLSVDTANKEAAKSAKNAAAKAPEVPKPVKIATQLDPTPKQAAALAAIASVKD